MYHNLPASFIVCFSSPSHLTFTNPPTTKTENPPSFPLSFPPSFLPPPFLPSVTFPLPPSLRHFPPPSLHHSPFTLPIPSFLHPYLSTKMSPCQKYLYIPPLLYLLTLWMFVISDLFSCITPSLSFTACPNLCSDVFVCQLVFAQIGRASCRERVSQLV